MRDEIHELLQLADYICFREYPHLLAVISPANRYIQLYREIANKTAFLVTEWLRVGFVQGNMNSDNTLLGGRTVDYGPYGFLEDYNPFYQPFTSDTDGKFAYIRQASAMSVNVKVLGRSIEKLLSAIVLDQNEKEKKLEEINKIADDEFENLFMKHYTAMQRSKLGLFGDDDTTSIRQLYKDLEQLMYNCHVDFTVFFRLLCSVDPQQGAEEVTNG